MAVRNGQRFVRTIHSIESDYFRSKFEPDLVKFDGRLGIGVISDNDSQPLVIGSHLGTFAIVTVARIVNMAPLTEEAYRRGQQFSESTGSAVNPTELVANMKLIPLKSLIPGQRILFCDDSIVRGTQLKNNVEDLFGGGASEVHMRIACPTLIFLCDFLIFSTSRSTLDLAGRRAVTELEGREAVDGEVLREYATAGTQRHGAMVEAIRRRLHLTTLKYQTMDDLVAAIGLPKNRLCTHCWDGSSYF